MRRLTFPTLTALLWSAAVLLAAVAVVRGWRPFGAPPVNVVAAKGPAPSRHSPYYIERETRPKREPERVVARSVSGLRSDGSFAEQINLIRINGTTVTRRIRFYSGPIWLADDVRQQRLEVPSGPATANLFRDPSTDCTKTYDGVQVRGDKVVGFRRIGQFDTVQITANGVTGSYALSLSCAILARETADTQETALIIKAAEPPPELFQIADEYHLVTPEQFGKPEVRK